MALSWRSDEFRTQIRADLTPEQHKRFAKLYSEDFYLLDHASEAGNKYTFKISGSRRSVYTVRLYSNGTLFCDCPDMKVHCRKHACVCKHVCFTLVRVLKHYDMTFYANLRLGGDALTEIHSRIENLGMSLDEQISNIALSDKYKQVASSFAYTKPVRPGDECPICYDEFGTTPLVGCPTCKNGFHERCMQKWLSSARHATCVYCRSSVWKTYGSSSSHEYQYQTV